MSSPLDQGAVFKCPVCSKGEVHHFHTDRRFQSDLHEFKCTNCQSEFTERAAGKYQLLSFPDAYSYTATFYKDDDRSPDEWGTVSILTNAAIEDVAEGNDLLTPRVRAQDPPIILQKDEIAYVAWSGWMYSEIASRTIRTTLPMGVSVARGVRVFVPSLTKTETYLKPLDVGTFVLTNKRYAFVGHNKTVSAKVDKIVSIETYLDGFSLARTGKQKIEFFTGRPGLLFGTMIRAMVREIHAPIEQPTITIDVSTGGNIVTVPGQRPPPPKPKPGVLDPAPRP